MKITITGRTESYLIETGMYDVVLMHTQYFNPPILDYDITSIYDKFGTPVTLPEKQQAVLQESILEQLAKLDALGKFK